LAGPCEAVIQTLETLRGGGRPEGPAGGPGQGPTREASYLINQVSESRSEPELPPKSSTPPEVSCAAEAS